MVRERVGVGRSSEVFRVELTEPRFGLNVGDVVALKLLSRSQGQLVRQRLFLNEVGSLLSLRHENIVRLFEANLLPDQTPYLLTEYLHHDLEAWTGQWDHLPVERFLQAARQLAQGLSFAHARGVIHGDLKPSNILVTELGSPTFKLCDFGLAQMTSRGVLMGSGSSGEGALAYAAPERIGVLQASFGPVSDLFSLGVIFFEMLTGHLPYRARSIRGLIEEMRRGFRVRLSDHRADVPEHLGALLERLLAIDPDERLNSSLQLVGELERLLDQDAPSAAGHHAQRVNLRGPHELPLVGREAVVRFLEHQWRSIQLDNTARVVELAGPEFSGREAVVGRFLERIPALVGVLWGHASDNPAAPPSLPLVEWLLACLEHVQGLPMEFRQKSIREIHERMGRLLMLLEPLVPSISSVLGESRPPETLEPSAERPRLVESLVIFLEAVSPEGGMVLVLNGLETLDGLTRDVLEQLHGRATERPLMVVALRTADAPAQPVVEGAHIRSLARLSDDEVLELAAAVVDRSRQDLGEDLCRTLVRRAEGLPGVLLAYLEELNLGGHLEEDRAGRLRLSSDAGLPTITPQFMVEHLRHKVEQLSAEQMQILRLLVVLEGPIRLSTLSTLVGLPPARTQDVLEGLERAVLLSSRRGRRIVHASPTLRSVLRDELEGVLTDTIRQGLIQCIEDERELLDLSVLFLAAELACAHQLPQSPLQHWVLLTAAERARSIFSTRRAERCYQALLERTQAGDPDLAKIHKGLADTLVHKGALGDALDVYEQALELSPTAEEEAAIHMGRLDAFYRVEDREEEAVQAGIQGLSALGLRIPSRTWVPFLMFFALLRTLLSITFRRPSLNEETTRLSDSQEMTFTILSWMVLPLQVLGRLSMMGYCSLKAYSMARRGGFSPQRAQATTILGAILASAGLERLAERCFGEARAISRACEDHRSEAFVYQIQGVTLLVSQGDVQAIRASFSQALSCYERSGDTSNTAMAHYQMANLGLHFLSADEVDRHLDAAREHVRRFGFSQVEMPVQAQSLALELMRSEHPDVEMRERLQAWRERLSTVSRLDHALAAVALASGATCSGLHEDALFFAERALALNKAARSTHMTTRLAELVMAWSLTRAIDANVDVDPALRKQLSRFLRTGRKLVRSLPMGRPLYLLARARYQGMNGQLSAARKTLAEGLLFCKQNSYRFWEWRLHETFGEHFETSDLQRAQLHQQQARALASTLGYRSQPSFTGDARWEDFAGELSSLLREVAGELSGLEPANLQQRALEALLDQTRADRAVLITREEGSLSLRAACLRDRTGAKRNVRYDNGDLDAFDGSLQAVEMGLASREAFLVEDVKGHSLSDAPSILQGDLSSILCVPLQLEDRPPIGLIYLDIRQGTYVFDERAVELARVLAPLLTLILETGVLNEALSQEVVLHRQAAARYTAMYTQATDAIAFIDPHRAGRFVDWNSAAERLLGDEALKIRGACLPDVVEGEPRNLLEHAVHEARSGRTTNLFGIELLDASVDLSVHPLRDATGGVTVAQVVAIDRSLRDAHERRRLWREKWKSLSAVTGGLAHDFRHTLATLEKLITSGLEDRKLFFDTVRRGYDLCGELMTMVRTEPATLESVDPTQLLHKTAELLRSQSDNAARVELALNHGETRVHAHPPALERMLTNLGANALDALEGSGSIHFTTRVEALSQAQVQGHRAPGSYLVLEVRDTGRGMDEESLARCFEPYFTSKKTTQGTGLGLAVVYSVVERHRGFVDVESLPGRGTTFRIFLPLKAPDDISPPSPLPAVSKTSLTDAVKPHESRNVTILVAEDDDALRQAYVYYLNTHGFTLLTARDGREALDALNTQRASIGLVLLDFNMPGLDGGEVIRWLQDEANSEIPVILLTGRDVMDPEIQALSRRSNIELLSKTMALEGIRRRIEILLDPEGKALDLPPRRRAITPPSVFAPAKTHKNISTPERRKTQPTPRVIPNTSSRLPPQQEAKRVSLALLDTLLDAGIDTVFGIPGSTISPLFDSLHERPQMRLITAKQETGCAFMAAGWAKATGRPGVVLVTSGPGVLNAVNGIASAFYDSIPLVLIAGEVPQTNFGRGALQEGSQHGLDVISIYRSITKMAQQIPSARLAPGLLRKALVTAQSGLTGPCMLTLPVDLAADSITVRPISGIVRSAGQIDEEICRMAADQLCHSRRPLIFAGSGAKTGTAAFWLKRIAEVLRAPVMTSLKAKGVFPESHELALGIFGHSGHPRPLAYLEEGVDVLMLIGCGLSDTSTFGWTQLLEPSRSLIQIDIDSGKIARNYTVDIGMVGDATVLLERIYKIVVERVDFDRSFARREQLLSFLERVPPYVDVEARSSGATPLHPARAVVDLQTAMPANTVFTVDIGEHMAFAVHHLSIDEPDGFSAHTGLGSMGSGIGAAIGLQAAHGAERPVVAICGDGGFLMHGGELATCVTNRLPVIFAIFNDNRLGMVVHGSRQVYGRSLAYEHPNVDFARFAESMGALGVRIEHPAELTVERVAEWRSRRLPIVLDIRIDPEQSMPSNNARNALLQHFGAEEEEDSV